MMENRHLNFNQPILLLLWAAGQAAVLLVAASIAARVPDLWWRDYIGFVIMGVGLGLIQWLVIKQMFSIVAYQWILATTFGFAIGSFGAAWGQLLDKFIVHSPPGGPILAWDSLIGGALLGLAIGVFQGLCWYKRPFHALGWLMMNLLGWSVGFMGIDVLVFYLHTTTAVHISPVMQFVLQIVLAGIFTSSALVKMGSPQPDSRIDYEIIQT